MRHLKEARLMRHNEAHLMRPLTDPCRAYAASPSSPATTLPFPGKSGVYTYIQIQARKQTHNHTHTRARTRTQTHTANT